MRSPIPTIALAMVIAPALSPMGAASAAEAASFNPDISLILDLRAADLDFGDADRDIPGFQLGPEAGVGSDGLYVGESELTISANIDDRYYGYATVGIHMDGGETEVELEEAYIETLALPHGLTVKAGRFFSHIGYQNIRHVHTWDFVDASLPQRAMLANNFGDAGVQLRWVAPTDLYLELGTEYFEGDAFPAGGSGGAWSLFARSGGDVGDSHSWTAGISHLAARAIEREPGHAHGEEDPAAEPGLAFDGDSDLSIVDFTWKWAPRGNWRERNAVISAAWYDRSESGDVELELDPTPELGTYAGDQSGFYVQGVYMFMPRWRIGLRYDRLSSDNTVLGLSELTVLDEDQHAPSRFSVMLDFSNSEYSRVRLQFNRDESLPVAEDQIFVQFIGSLGPHGAHRF